MTSLTDASDDALDISSLDEYDSFDELTQESRSGFDAGHAARSYWLGKKFMSLALAYNMLQAAGPDETAIDIDVKVEDALRRWPYTPSLRTILSAFESTLPHDLRSNTGQDYEAFMCALGHILLQPSTKNSPGLGTILESFRAEGEDWAGAFEVQLGSGTRVRAVDLTGNKTTTKESDFDYYKAVKAYCQHKTETLGKSTEQVHDGQSHGVRWKTTLTITTQKFQGKGRTMRESTQKAAKQAYSAFGLGRKA